MDFANRNVQNRAAAPASPASPVNGSNDKKTEKKGRFHNKWFKIGALILLYGGTIIVVAILLLFKFGPTTNDEAKFVSKDEMQAVFVNVNGTNGGQVYFGNIKSLTKDYINLTGVFYIQNQATAQNTAQADSQAYNLVKLGCELHGPKDQMIINRSQVFFWENLQNSSQVAQKAAEFKKNNPNGQNCSQQQNSSTQQGTGTSTQNTTSGTGTTTQGTTAPAATGQTTTQNR